MWPAEWRVFRYGPGLPIEQTRRRTGVAICGREVRRKEERADFIASDSWCT